MEYIVYKNGIPIKIKNSSIEAFKLAHEMLLHPDCDKISIERFENVDFNFDEEILLFNNIDRIENEFNKIHTDYSKAITKMNKILSRN
jgi:hypothetical protein